MIGHDGLLRGVLGMSDRFTTREAKTAQGFAVPPPFNSFNAGTVFIRKNLTSTVCMFGKLSLRLLSNYTVTNTFGSCQKQLFQYGAMRNFNSLILTD